jgi:hypothetical protein
VEGHAEASVRLGIERIAPDSVKRRLHVFAAGTREPTECQSRNLGQRLAPAGDDRQQAQHDARLRIEGP